ncbi:MAG: DMT family transporter [Blastocatellia bacterium]
MSKSSLTAEQSSADAAHGPARGYLLAGAAAILWGFSGVVTKFLLRRKMLPDELLLFRTTFASLLMLGWLRLTSPRLLRIQRSDLRYFALLGLFGMVTSQGFYYFALSYTSVGIALLIQYQAPVILMIYGVISGTERIGPGKLLAAALATGGCALMIYGQAGGMGRLSLPGALFAIGSAFGFAFYSGFGKHGLERYDPRTMVTYAFIFSTFVWMARLPPWRVPWASYDLSIMAFFLYLAAVATILPFLLYFASLRYLEPSRSSLTSMLEPVVAASVAWLWLGETMTRLQFLGGAGVLAGVLLLQAESRFLGKAGAAKKSDEKPG